MYYFKDQQEYRSFLYRRQLRSDANRVGFLLLLFFAAEFAVQTVVSLIIKAAGVDSVFSDGSTMTLLSNGIFTMFSFFAISALFCAAGKMSFARLLPFERIGGGMLASLCVVGLTLSVMGGYAVQLLTDVFSLFGITNRGGEIITKGELPSIPIYYLTVAVLPALAEEFAFRGVVMGVLRRHSAAMALLVSSAAFALMHGNFEQIPYTFCCGLLYGFITLKTNSLLPAVLCHFLNNALSVTHDVIVMYGVMDLTMWNILFQVLLLVLCAASIFLVRRIIVKKPGMFRFDDSDEGIPFREKIKAAASSPTIIAFASIMMLFSVYSLFRAG